MNSTLIIRQLVTVLWTLSGLLVPAQVSPSLRAALLEHVQENQRAMKQYSWKQRMEMLVNGESRGVRVDLTRFDAQRPEPLFRYFSKRAA